MTRLLDSYAPSLYLSPRKRGEGTNAVEERLATPSPPEMGRVGVRGNGLVNFEMWYERFGATTIDMIRSVPIAALLLVVWPLFLGASPPPPPPGVVIHHSYAATGLHIGSPSLVLLPDGAYLASHDLFGPASQEHILATGRIYRSRDRGASWQHLADLKGFFWQNLFVHRGKVHALGLDRHHGKLVIRRSDDGGRTWSEPTDATSGVIAAGQWHTAPVPVIEAGGRLWRAVEDAEGGTKWGERYRARMISAPLGADLLRADSWTISNPLARDPTWLGGNFRAWLEGNAVVAPDASVVNLLRVDTPGLPEKAALVRVGADGKTATFDPEHDFLDFDGGAKKFVIRKDPHGGGYWALANVIPPEVVASHPRKLAPGAIRNTLALVRSDDLRHWATRCILLRHADTAKHGLQYADWQFDNDDLVAVVRTAWDDSEGGARNHHDANFLTFHRWPNFRALTRKDDVAMPDP